MSPRSLELPRANGGHGDFARNPMLLQPKKLRPHSNHELTIFVISKPGFTLQSLISSPTTASWKTCSRRVAVGGTRFIRSILTLLVFGISHTPATTRHGMKQCFTLDIRAAIYVALVTSSSSPKRTVNGRSRID